MKPGDKVKIVSNQVSNGVSYTQTKHGVILEVNGALALVEYANFGTIDKRLFKLTDLQLG